MFKKMIMLFILLTMSLKSYCPGCPAVLYIAEPVRIQFVDMHDVDVLFKKHNIKYPKIVKCQIMLESDHLRSSICKQNRNLFGMRYAPGRKTTAIGEQFGMALYETYEKSVQDYKIWQELYYRGGDYYLFLKRIGYAEDKNYITKLKRLSTYKN
jgi:hypothetical protein